MVRNSGSAPFPSSKRRAWRHTLVALALLAPLLACAGDSSVRANSDGVDAIDLAEQAEPVRLELLWRERLVGGGTWDWAAIEYSQPTVCCGGDHVVVGTSKGDLLVLNMVTGRTIWSYKTDAGIDARPATDEDDDEVIVVGNDAGSLYALDISQGLLWKRQLPGELDGAPTIRDGRVFVMSSNEVLHAYDLESGGRLWDYERKVPDYFTLHGLSDPLVENGRVYCGFADGYLVALEADTGETIWLRDLSGGETEFVDVDSKPVLDDGRIYAASYSGGVFALDAASGEQLWREPMVGAAAITMADDLLYTTTSGRYVMALNPNTGERIWRVRHKHAIPTAPVALGNYLLYGSTDEGVYVLDRNLGLPIVKFDPNVGFSAPLMVVDSRVFMLSNHGVFYAFQLKRAARTYNVQLGRRDSPRP